MRTIEKDRPPKEIQEVIVRRHDDCFRQNRPVTLMEDFLVGSSIPEGLQYRTLSKCYLVFALIMRFGAGEEGSLFDIISPS
jgi:hypothetical protein